MTLRSSASRRTLLIVGTMLATMLYAIDTTIVNVALPHIQGALQASQDQVAWVLTSYIVMSAIATPLAGWLGPRFGLRRVLAIAIVGFTLGSVACGFATSLAAIVVCRTLQGLCGAALVPLSQVALLQGFPQEQHGRVMGLWAIGVMVGPIFGPTLGGYLTDELSWRWTFFINVPVGAIAYFAILEGMGEAEPNRGRPFDWLGFVLLSVGLALVQLMLDRGQTLNWFSSTEIVAECFFGVVALYMFVAHARTASHPFVDLALLRDRNYAIGLVLMFMIGVAILSPAVLLPTFLQHLQGYSPTQAGTIVAVRGLSAVLAAFIAGRLSGRVDPRLVICAGVISGSLALLLLGGFTLDTPRSYVTLAMFFVGLGTPLVFVPLSIVGYQTLPPERRAEAGSILTLARSVGMSIGISVAVAMLARYTQVNTSYLVEHFSAYDSTRWQALGTEPGANVPTAYLLGEIERQAAVIGYANDYHVLALGTLLVLPLVFLIRVRREPAAVPVEVVELA